LIEVLMAAGVLEVLALFSLAIVWRLVGFAHEEAERLAADGYCHDVMRRFVAMDDQTLATHGEREYAVPVETLPVMIRTSWNGRRDEICPLWRDRRDATLEPTCTVNVEPCTVGKDSDGKLKATVVSGFDVSSNALITVSFTWGRSFAWGRSDDAARTNLVHRLQCVRAGNFDRWQAANAGGASK